MEDIKIDNELKTIIDETFNNFINEYEYKIKEIKDILTIDMELKKLLKIYKKELDNLFEEFHEVVYSVWHDIKYCDENFINFDFFYKVLKNKLTIYLKD